MKPLTVPCGNCPFRKKGGIPLRRGRLRGIVDDTIRSDQSFFCHKTCDYSGDDPDGTVASNSQLCAGWEIFLLAHRGGHMTQMMRIEYRLGILDPDELLKHRDLIKERVT